MSEPESKVDFSKLGKANLDLIKLIEEKNRARVEKLRKVRKNNLITAGIIGCCVLSIYTYSIFAIKQEKFLDDFEEPQKIIEVKK
ncbi:cytochrome c oxidase assembly factor 3, mitochondrial [Agrilus planipennis]|uniref:Cytochrome c oxidase assembly factor 3 n=1 Tax=Agrilus planipennis TaxID=224129 RepID=A0A1W4XIQ0_AGRPL|nr:cytochrome c oxidase assembly factor 3, mitochondrial [Agrilus planipennis]